MNTKNWLWWLLTILVLLGIVLGLWVATKRIDYTWRWNRVPQYFFYQDKDVKKTVIDGTVTKIEQKGKTSIITVHNSDNEDNVFIVDTETVNLDVDDYLMEDDTVGAILDWKAGPLVTGLWVTLWISALASIIGLVIGVVTGLCRVSKNLTLRQLSITYIELIRGTPLLVQLFIFYFFLGTVLDIGRLASGIFALAIFAGAYVAEIIRAGIQSIPKGQMEAARSLGMNVPQAMIYIILPQAFKRTLPPLAGQFISLIKDSSLVSVIAITDLTKSGREVITSTFAVFEIWFVVAFLYLILTFSLSQVVAWVERRLAVSD
ncbi:polar amino acid transport system permease protein [Desulfuromusa kysingii]|uniref:Putative glutamine transport system permease protein GlnP n=1 Tax=Desulfuromusa kysingii TaxID=37625 RepID=A0A1H4BIN6_9BACT|nr:amino acid ABC transporter permease [Desulfuromusa kysingii]SEA47967.1 polar amino acid transport system permease protein [Desulfuromusa kysingii]